jgi:hypothetical protein
MVCSNTTEDWLEMRMDRLIATTSNPSSTKCKEGPFCPLFNEQYFIGKVTIGTNSTLKWAPDILVKYQWHNKIFSEQESQRLPKHTIWDHAIELLPGAPSTLLGWLLPLTQEEIEEARKFMKEHLQRNTIRPSWSPYAANFFFVKKKDRKLRPV